MNFIIVNLIFNKCRKLFLKKLEDYNVSWIFLKTTSIIDQILIKSIRVRNIQVNQYQLIKEEGITDTCIDIINYIIIILIKSNIKSCDNISHSKIITMYDRNIKSIKNSLILIEKKKKFYSINNVLYNISYLKHEKNKQLKTILFDMLINIVYLLKNSIFKKNANKKKNCDCKLEDESWIL
ncbi:nucleotide modification associated domain-containing protein [Blattabacterium cuenoti]|uniref:nucleotide modification associated domain-containing protein n=1 Tax=Blattabacterium cuenoti TaxID=1653831 RepID=UPI00163D2CF5|nr:nucleotide modification associated domain-containing protein [Blattabacterium cuenoti]